MKRLENYGVVSLEAQEARELNGGVVPLIIIGGAYLLYKAGEAVVDGLKGAYEQGYDEGMKNCN